MEQKKSAATPAKSGFLWKTLLDNEWLCVGILALLVIIIFTPFLFSDKMLYGSDTMGGLDSRVFLKNAIEKYHQFPMWFNTRLGGMPTIDALFGDAMYLPTLAIDAVLPIARALGIRLVLHVFLAGLFFFLLLRRGFKVPGPGRGDRRGPVHAQSRIRVACVSGTRRKNVRYRAAAVRGVAHQIAHRNANFLNSTFWALASRCAFSRRTFRCRISCCGAFSCIGCVCQFYRGEPTRK